jgi:hypothetical protein
MIVGNKVAVKAGKLGIDLELGRLVPPTEQLVESGVDKTQRMKRSDTLNLSIRKLTEILNAIQN